MLAAVEMWVKRDHKAEWARWEEWLNTIAASVKRVDGVSAKINQPSADLSNRTPELMIEWDAQKLGIGGQELSKYVFDTEPRISLARAGAGFVAVVPYQMMPGEEKVVADRLYALLSKPPKIAPPPAAPDELAASVAGLWDVHVEFNYGSAHHKVVLEQDGGKLVGTLETHFATADLMGSVAGSAVRFQSSVTTPGIRVGFQFAGRIEGEEMAGTVGLGEYGEAKWRGVRHQYRRG
jgi:L-seryl-tRNA(Ser) seleniumtransferase